MRAMKKHRSNIPTKPGLYYYRMNGGGAWRHQEVFWHKQGALAVLCVNNSEGPKPIYNMHRHWMTAGQTPGALTKKP